MKLLSTLLGLLAVFLSVGPAEATNAAVLNWRHKCQHKKPAIANAIGNFCNLAGMSNHVPRAWTETGSHSDYSKFPRVAVVKISGSCYPQQNIVSSSSHKMCVDFGGDGSGQRLFGTNLCQSWTIQRGPPHSPSGFIGKREDGDEEGEEYEGDGDESGEEGDEYEEE